MTTEEKQEHILLCVLSHDELLESLKQTLDALCNQTHGQKDTPWITETKNKARAAITRAEGQQ